MGGRVKFNGKNEWTGASASGVRHSLSVNASTEYGIPESVIENLPRGASQLTQEFNDGRLAGRWMSAVTSAVDVAYIGHTLEHSSRHVSTIAEDLTSRGPFGRSLNPSRRPQMTHFGLPCSLGSPTNITYHAWTDIFFAKPLISELTGHLSLQRSTDCEDVLITCVHPTKESWFCYLSDTRRCSLPGTSYSSLLCKCPYCDTILAPVPLGSLLAWLPLFQISWKRTPHATQLM